MYFYQLFVFAISSWATWILTDVPGRWAVRLWLAVFGTRYQRTLLSSASVCSFAGLNHCRAQSMMSAVSCSHIMQNLSFGPTKSPSSLFPTSCSQTLLVCERMLQLQDLLSLGSQWATLVALQLFFNLCGATSLFLLSICLCKCGTTAARQSQSVA